MKHFSSKVEVILVIGAWLIASGLEIASYFTATTPKDKFLGVLAFILVSILAGWYAWSVIQISRLQKILEERKKQLQAYERIQENIDEVLRIVSQAQS